MPDQPPSPATDAVKALTEFLCEPAQDKPPRDQIQAELRKASVDLPALRRRIQASITQAKGQHRLDQARAKRLAMLARFRNLVPTQSLAKTKEQVHQILQETFGANPQMAVLFRKFEESSDADLNSLLEDIALLDDTDDHPPQS